MRVLRLALLAVGFLLNACERAKETAAAGVPAVSATSSSGPQVEVTWDGEFGAFVAIPSTENGQPVLFVRDSATIGDVPLEFFSHDERTLSATFRATGPAGDCPWMRTGTIAPDGSAPPPWSLALAPGIATAVGIEGAADLPPRDSTALVAAVARLVSALPEDSASAGFRGLPVVVRDVWRFRALEASTDIIAAIALRSTNLESNPRTEVIIVIAEWTATAARELRTVFSRRASGPEEVIEGTEVLAALRLKNGRTSIALLREDDAGVRVEFLERRPDGTWEERWTSARIGCRTGATHGPPARD